MALLRVSRLPLPDLSSIAYVSKFASSHKMNSFCCYVSITTTLSKQLHVSLHAVVKKSGAPRLSCELDAVLLFFVGYFEDHDLHFAMFNKL